MKKTAALLYAIITLLLLFASVARASADEPEIVTGVTTATDINLYYFIVAVLIITAVLAFFVFDYIGVFGGLVGIIATGFLINNGYLLMHQYFDQTRVEIINVIQPLGVYVWFPVVLIIANFVIVLVKVAR